MWTRNPISTPLGIVMYEMLTGRVPFDGDNPVNIALMHINGEMIPPSKLVDGVPPALEHIILKCTDKYPVNRFASADELIEALNNLEFVSTGSRRFRFSKRSETVMNREVRSLKQITMTARTNT